MTTAPTDSRPRPARSRDDSINASLDLVERLLDEWSARMFDSEYFAAVGAELRRLHARIRIHRAAQSVLPPEYAEEISRLNAEHPRILGQLDRIVRSVDSMADRSLEDKEVFVALIHELIAVLRRREAEEDRLLYLAVWRDTGGEA